MKTTRYFLFVITILFLSGCSQGSIDTCTPKCDGKQCGDDRCQGTCLPGCSAGETCDAAGQCVPASTDTTPPSGITDLTASSMTENSITLSWTAPGDDGTTGTASQYDIRYSTTSITDGNWTSAMEVGNEPAPLVSGTSQSQVVSGLASDTTYTFAIKTTDDVGNVSALSNVASGKTSAEEVTPDVIVYQDETNTYAKNKAGTILSTVSRASLTDHIPINAAIAAGTVVKFIGTGSYTINGYLSISNKSNFVLDFNGSTINAGSSIGNEHLNWDDPSNNHGMLGIGKSSNVTVKNGIFDANMRPGGSGILIDTGTTNRRTSHDILISTMEIKNCGIWNQPAPVSAHLCDGQVLYGGTLGTPSQDCENTRKYASIRGGRGVFSMDAVRVTVDNCNIHDVGVGVNFQAATARRVDNVISNTTIANATQQGIKSYTGIAIYVFGQNGCVVRHCHLSGCPDDRGAIWLGEGIKDDAGVYENTFTLEDSVITNNRFGMNAGGGFPYANLMIRRCEFSHNTIAFDNIDMGEISECTFLNNGTAIATSGGTYVSAPQTAYITRNTFVDNEYAYSHVSGSTSNNKIGISFTGNQLKRVVDPIRIVPAGGGTISAIVTGNTNYGFLDNAVSFSTDTPQLGEMITCTSTVKNTGTTSDTFKVSFSYQGGVPFYTSPNQPIAPGATVVTTTEFQCVEAGNVNISADAVSTLPIVP
jgi:hypothetical protein